MTIYYNKTNTTSVDGIFVNFFTPPPSIRGALTNRVGCVATFDWGPSNTPIQIISTDVIRNNFGFFSDFEAQMAGPLDFQSLYVVRVSSEDDTFAADTVATGFTITSKYPGKGGNYIRYTISNASDAVANHFKLTVNAYATTVFEGKEYSQISVNTDIFDNVDFTTSTGITAFQNSVIANSKFITVGNVTASTRPANVSVTYLEGGVTGVPSQSEYTAAFASLASLGKMNVILSTDARAGDDDVNTAILNYTNGGGSNMGIVTLTPVRATAVTEVVPFNTAFANMIATCGHVKKKDFYGRNYGAPVSLIAAATLANTTPDIDPAFVDNRKFFIGVSAFDNTPAFQDPSDYEAFRAAGIMAPEYDKLYGFKFKSGITTQTLVPDLIPVYTRRMTDYLSESIAAFLINFQNAPYTIDNQLAVQAAMETFIKQEQAAGRLPPGQSYYIDVFGQNTPDIVAQGIFIIDYRQRLNNSMAFINLRVTIGPSVDVTLNVTPTT